MTSVKGFLFSFNALLKLPLCATFLLVLTLLFPFTQAEAKSNPKYASLIMDADTGMILYQRYADKKLHPASLTKVMTLLMLFDALEDGRVKPTDRIRISRRAASMQPSKLGIPAGGSIKVKDAIYVLVTKSANDIAVAVAEHLAENESKFAAAMTRRARGIGMSRTNFRNASGLHHPRQISTARDMVKLARYVITQYPQYYKHFSRKSFTYAGKTYRSHNKLLGKYKGMDGMKTGYIRASGFNLLTSAVRDNNRLIGVVFGGRSGKSRNAHMKVLLDRGFKKIKKIRLANATAPLPPRKPNVLLAMNTLNTIAPAAGMASTPPSFINSAYSPSSFKGTVVTRMIGKGGYDSNILQRLETGLIAINAHKNKAAQKTKPVLARYTKQKDLPHASKSWAIQIGAFRSKRQTDKVLKQSAKQLPSLYARADQVISPLRTSEGWLFRGRLQGYNRAQAFEACKYLSDCMPIAP